MSCRYRVAAGLVALLCLACGCTRSLSGTWQDAAGLTTYQFGQDGSIVMTILGTSVRGDYQIQGDRVVVNGPQGTVVLLRDGDRLSGPTGLELTLRHRAPAQVSNRRRVAPRRATPRPAPQTRLPPALQTWARRGRSSAACK